MSISKPNTRRFVDLLLPMAVLAILLAYSYVRFFSISYIGFQFNGASGEIVEIHIPQTDPPSLQPGDILRSVNGFSWERLHEGFVANPLADVRPGETVNLSALGSEGTKTVNWVAPGFNMPEFLTRLVNTWPLGYAFWLAGTATLLLVRPKDERWALLVAFNYVTAIWFTAGGLSSWGVAASALIFRDFVWLSFPIYIHFHWNFPNRLRPIPWVVWIILYLASFLMIGAQGIGLIGRDEYFFAFLAAVSLSGLILLYRFVSRPHERREIGLLFFATTFAFAPAVLVALTSGESSADPALPGLLLSLLALPGAYFFVVYRRQLGGLELRANRLISFYLFVVLLITFSLALFPVISAAVGGVETASGAIVLTAMATALVTSLGFTPFQHFVESRLLHIPKTEEGLLSKFASQISTTMSEQNLATILENHVLPSLLVRQSALFAFGDSDQSTSVIYAQGVKQAQLPNSVQIRGWAEIPDILEGGNPVHGWPRLALPLRMAGSVGGLWLLGRKDPDDFYHQNERELLASLADQMAIALTNISQSRNLLALHQADIERQEAERINLARELHDDVLPRINELGQEAASAKLEKNVDQLIELIRRLMAGLRPPLLDQGLYLALEQLVDDLTPNLPRATNLIFHIPSNLSRFDPAVEQHLFRIVQQAAQNALKHSSPKTVTISGKIGENGVNLSIFDDGIGFELAGTSLADLLRTRHFGLAGMSERAAMIGAELSIDSVLGKGTRVGLVWSVGNED